MDLPSCGVSNQKSARRSQRSRATEKGESHGLSVGAVGPREHPNVETIPVRDTPAVRVARGSAFRADAGGRASGSLASARGSVDAGHREGLHSQRQGKGLLSRVAVSEVTEPLWVE
jgi:hypothetical protein